MACLRGLRSPLNELRAHLVTSSVLLSILHLHVITEQRLLSVAHFFLLQSVRVEWTRRAGCRTTIMEYTHWIISLSTSRRACREPAEQPKYNRKQGMLHFLKAEGDKLKLYYKKPEGKAWVIFLLIEARVSPLLVAPFLLR